MMIKRALVVMAMAITALSLTGTPAASANAGKVNWGDCMAQVAQGAGTGHPADYAPPQTNVGPLNNGNTPFGGSMGC